jgi:hypothetical protein
MAGSITVKRCIAVLNNRCAISPDYLFRGDEPMYTWAVLCQSFTAAFQALTAESLSLGHRYSQTVGIVASVYSTGFSPP